MISDCKIFLLCIWYMFQTAAVLFKIHQFRKDIVFDCLKVSDIFYIELKISCECRSHIFHIDIGYLCNDLIQISSILILLI